jgi:hypothetical protein
MGNPFNQNQLEVYDLDKDAEEKPILHENYRDNCPFTLTNE